MQRNIIKRLTLWAAVVAAILMIPLLLRWPWTGSDFVFGGGMLFGSAVLFEIISYRMTNKTHQMIVGLAVFFVLALVWIIAATGD